MIAASRSLWIVALAIAVIVHAALGWALVADNRVETEGGAGAQEVRIGTSFADMAAGTPEATEPTEIVQPEAATPAPAAHVQHAEPLTPPQDEVPAEAPRVMPQLADDAVPTVVAALPETPVVSQPIAKSQDVIEADETAEPAVTRSLRPKRRSDAFEEKNRPVVEKTAPKKPTPKREPARTTRGSAEQNQRAGSTSGSDQAAAASPGAARANSAAPGNAAASNYPGLVMQRISRVPRPRSGSRGTAVVAFSISASGGLAGVSIARTSGSATLDSAAVRMIHTAAPFPPPPSGARRSFSLSIEGR